MASPTNEYPSLALIRQGINYRFKVKLRGMEFNFRPLSVMEEDQITQDVVVKLNELPEFQRTSLKQSLLLSIKKLELAQTSDVGVHDQKAHAIELERLTPGEINYLFKEYCAGSDKLNPSLENYSAKEVEEWVNKLKKNSQDTATILTESSFFQLVALCQHLLTTQGSLEDN